MRQEQEIYVVELVRARCRWCGATDALRSTGKRKEVGGVWRYQYSCRNSDCEYLAEHGVRWHYWVRWTHRIPQTMAEAAR